MAAGLPDTWPIGADVVLATTDDGEELRGEILAHDAENKVIVLKQPSRIYQRHTLHFLNLSIIKSVKSLTPPRQPPGELQPLDMASLKEKAAAELQAAKLRATRIGVGVSKEGQQVFDALVKTMECRWSGTTIICMDEVTVKEPYQEDDVAPIGKEHHSTCDRIRQMVKEERSRWGK